VANARGSAAISARPAAVAAAREMRRSEMIPPNAPAAGTAGRRLPGRRSVAEVGALPRRPRRRLRAAQVVTRRAEAQTRRQPSLREARVLRRTRASVRRAEAEARQAQSLELRPQPRQPRRRRRRDPRAEARAELARKPERHHQPRTQVGHVLARRRKGR